MKWVTLAIFLGAVLPIAKWLRRNPDDVPKVWMLLGFLLFVWQPLHLYSFPLTWLDWPGPAKGIEVTAVDALALSLYLSLPPARCALPFRLPMIFYFFSVLASVAQAAAPIASLFYVWQVLRMFLIFAVVARGCADPRVPSALLRGMAIGMFLETGLALWQRARWGMLPTGTFDHQNILGMATHFIVLPFFGLLLSRRRGWLPPAVLIAGIVVDVLTTSRGAVGFAGIGCVALFVLSFLRRGTTRKVLLFFAGVGMIAVVAPIALSSIAERGASGGAAFAGSDEERVVLEAAAAKMLRDHPFGVGSNNFVTVANIGGYYQELFAAGWYQGGALVHNVYWLVAAETGYLGFVALVILLLRPLTVVPSLVVSHRKDERGDLILALGTALLAVSLQSRVEWVLITSVLQYFFSVEMGLLAGLAVQLGYLRPRPKTIEGVVRRRVVNVRTQSAKIIRKPD